MIVPVRCDRCRQTAEQAGTEIDEGLCANCLRERVTPAPWHVWNRGVGWEIHEGAEPSNGKHWWLKGEYGHERSGECHRINNENTEGDCFKEEDARRIVACVNACKGLRTEWLESQPMGVFLNAVAAK